MIPSKLGVHNFHPGEGFPPMPVVTNNAYIITFITHSSVCRSVVIHNTGSQSPLCGVSV